MRIVTIVSMVLALAAVVRAADEGITVVGEGTIKAHATEVEIGATVSGEGELAADASVKYTDAKRRALAALDGLKNPSLSVESEGFAVNQAQDPSQQQRMMNGMGADPNTKQKVQVTEQLKLHLKDADKQEVKKLLETVLKVIDTGRDSGLAIGPSNMSIYQMQMAAQSGQGLALIRFVIADPSALKDQAYKAAVESAKAKAQRLAELSGVKLGAITSVQEQQTGNANMNNYWEAMAEANSTIDEKTLSSSIFGEIPVTVHLTVQFAIEK